MTQKNWNLDQFKQEIAKRKEVKSWILTQEHIRRCERYFMTSSGSHENKNEIQIIIDQDRNVHQENLTLRLMVYLPQDSKNNSNRQGEISKKLFYSLPISDQIDSAIQAALQTDHMAWELPTKVPSDLPELKTSDQKIRENIVETLKELTQRIMKSASKKRKAQFNSSELFISTHDRELFFSNDLTYRSSQSRIYTEAAFSYSKHDPKTGKIISDEYLSHQWSVTVEQLPIEKIFDETSERAESSLEVCKPQTGKYSVLIDSEVLATLVSDAVSQLSAANKYLGLPFISPGSELIPDASEDLMTITLDPTLAFGADTTALSHQGILQVPLALVDNNKVLSSMADKQFSDYLNIPTTTARGNLVLGAGSHTYQQLTSHAPQVLEILQFSGLFTDPNTGTFSSEIRLGKLHDRNTGKVTWIKGGSLSGSIQENFKKLKLSKTIIQKSHFSSESWIGQGYYGPEYALLQDVSIVG